MLIIGFKATGIFPFNPNAINKNKLITSSILNGEESTEKSTTQQINKSQQPHLDVDDPNGIGSILLNTLREQFTTNKYINQKSKRERLKRKFGESLTSPDVVNRLREAVNEKILAASQPAKPRGRPPKKRAKKETQNESKIDKIFCYECSRVFDHKATTSKLWRSCENNCDNWACGTCLKHLSLQNNEFICSECC